MKDIKLTENQLREKEKIEKLRHHFFDGNNYMVCTVVELPTTVDLSNLKENELQEKLDEHMLSLRKRFPSVMRKQRLTFEKERFKITEEEIDDYIENVYPNISKEDYRFKFEKYGERAYLVVFGTDSGLLNFAFFKDKPIDADYIMLFSSDICYPALQFLVDYIFNDNVWINPSLNNYEMSFGGNPFKKNNEENFIAHGFEIDNENSFSAYVACKEKNKYRDEYYELIFPISPNN